jgi:phospholipid/cholesterol/gamma-HCH transport system substrate-binding protein
METRASYLLVGTFVLVLVAAGFIFILWIAKAQVTRDTQTYLTYFTTTVTGLQTGSVVRYRGVPVGEVTHIRIDPKNPEQIEVTLDVDATTPIKTDTVAVLESQGITGVAFIQLRGGLRTSPTLVAQQGERYPVIKSEGSGFEKILTDFPKLLQSLNTLAESANAVLDEKNRESITVTLENVAKISKALGEREKEFDAALTNANKALESVNGLVNDMRPAINDIQAGVNSFSAMSNTVNKLVEENRRPWRDFSATGLYEFSLFITEARDLVQALTRISTKLEDDPARFLFGDTQKGFQPK